MFHQQLKERTTPSHQALEKRLVGQIKNISYASEYVDLLKMMYGYYSALENKLEKFLGPVPSIDFYERRKAVSILNDIQHFEPVGELPVCQQLPPIDSDASALGSMYVLEGSTLGGKIIAGMVARQLMLQNGTGLTFFQYYGDQAQAMWEKFKENLAQPFPETEQEEIVQSANQTFITFKNWIDEYTVG